MDTIKDEATNISELNSHINEGYHREYTFRQKVSAVIAGLSFGTMAFLVGGKAEAASEEPALGPGGILEVHVPEAVGGKWIIGQTTVDNTSQQGFITAYACDEGVPRDSLGNVNKSDLNYNGSLTPVASNRLIGQADLNGDICFMTSQAADLIVDVNGVAENSPSGILGIPHFRKDTRVGAGSTPFLPAEGVLQIHIPEAIGGKVVIGQTTVDRNSLPGFVTAFACDEGVPRDSLGNVDKSDLNYIGARNPVASNRLIQEADLDGDICFYSSQATDLIIDVTGVSETGIQGIPNQRTDTRLTAAPVLPAEGALKVHVPEAIGGQIVVGQATVDRTKLPGFVTAFACNEGIPVNEQGKISKSDLNFNGGISPVASNRLIQEADNEGNICFYTSQDAAVIIDINGIAQSSATGFEGIPNQRTDTREGVVPAEGVHVRGYFGPDPILLEQIPTKCEFQTFDGTDYVREFFKFEFNGLNPDTNPAPETNNGDKVRVVFSLFNSSGTEFRYDLLSNADSNGYAYVGGGKSDSSLDAAKRLIIDQLAIFRTAPDGQVSTTVLSINIACTPYVNPYP